MDFQELKNQFQAEIKNLGSFLDWENLRVKYLGKKGRINEFLKELVELSGEEKKKMGEAINELKTEMEELFEKARQQVSRADKGKLSDFQKSLPGQLPGIGHLHLITRAIKEITDIFKPLGFNLVRHPEVDWEYFAFEALNIPASHPARDEWETFFVDAPTDKKYGRLVITPHTSNGQAREMLKGQLPIRMLNISRCGRRQEDISHVPTFFQFEGLAVDKGINITNLKGTMDYFAKHFFGPDRETRLRPHHFGFTEPSFEVDINCGLCLGRGCRFCKGGWVELGGSGMVHPRVLEYGGIDPKKYSGFAFGWGIERTYMMKSGTQIDDIRYLFNNDLRFLEQF